MHYAFLIEGGYQIVGGRIDQIFYPYYKNDIQHHALTKDTALDKQFALRQYNNAEAMWKSTSVTATKGVYQVTDRTLKTGERQVGTGFIEQQLSMVLEDIEVNVLIENEKIYVSTDKIQEGYVTDFELLVGPKDSLETAKVKGTRSVLKGLERFNSALNWH